MTWEQAVEKLEAACAKAPGWQWSMTRNAWRSLSGTAGHRSDVTVLHYERIFVRHFDIESHGLDEAVRAAVDCIASCEASYRDLALSLIDGAAAASESS